MLLVQGCLDGRWGAGGRALEASWGAGGNPLPTALPPQNSPQDSVGLRGARGVQELMGEPASAGRDADSSPTQSSISELALIIPLSNQYNRAFARSYLTENTAG